MRQMVSILAIRAKWATSKDLWCMAHVPLGKSMQLGLNESSGMFLSHVGLKQALRVKSCRRVAGRCAIPFWGHLLLLHVRNPVLEVVKDGLRSLATFKHA